MTNEEWLSGLSTEEKAKLISNHSSCDFCSYQENKCINDIQFQDCENGICEWLNAEHKKPMPEIKEGDMFVYMQSQIPFYGACVYGNIVYLPGEEKCCNFGGEIKEKIIAIKRYNIAKGTMEDIWRADNGCIK